MVKSTKDSVTIYTDGACKGNPGIGGWGALIVGATNRTLIKGSELNTTNNRMELVAVIKSHEAVGIHLPIVLYTDSQYVKKGITEWISKWKRKSWRTASRKPVKNVDLWKSLDLLTEDRSVSWNWVRGHSGNEGNEIADSLANAAIEELRKDLNN